jgi:hypothetical protein
LEKKRNKESLVCLFNSTEPATALPKYTNIEGKLNIKNLQKQLAQTKENHDRGLGGCDFGHRNPQLLQTHVNRRKKYKNIYKKKFEKFEKKRTKERIRGQELHKLI